MENKPIDIDVMICTPGHSLMGVYVECLLRTTKELDRLGISWGFSNQYASHVADAREWTLNGKNENNIKDTRPFGGKINYKKIIWIDSDIAWEPADFLKLYYSDKDILAGAYLLANGYTTIQKELLKDFYTFDEIRNMNQEPFRIGGVGFGFISFKPGIFESLSRPWFQSVPVEVDLDGEPFRFNIIGEDLSLCARAAGVGYEIWADPTVRVTHHKMMKLTWEGIQP